MPQQKGKLIQSSDQYPGICSEEFRNYSHSQNIQLIFTAVNSPFPNGLKERVNQTLIDNAKMQNQRKKWKKVNLNNHSTHVHREI